MDHSIIGCVISSAQVRSLGAFACLGMTRVGARFENAHPIRGGYLAAARAG
ncbi:MAG: hypothetical protein M3505_07425 [Verrucomicrobiota bacterium]|nr:hypothetical protein [Chthoniobacterales bacterium]MDQ3314444.1 hypothetical protein [Verrucomicrobiota bacterium]